MPAIHPSKAKSVRKYKHSGTFYAVASAQKDGKIYAGGDDYSIHVFDLESQDAKVVAQWKAHQNYVSALAYVENGGKGMLISGSYDQQLIWWDIEKGTATRNIQAHDGWVREIVAYPDSRRVVSVGDDMLVKIWDVANGKLIHSLAGHATKTPQGHVTALYSVAVSPDGKHLASGDRHGEVRIWQAEDGKFVHSFQIPTIYTYDPRQRKRSIGGIRALTFSLDGKYLAVGGVGKIGNVDGFSGNVHMEIWDWQKPAKVLESNGNGQRGIINQMLYHPSGEWLIGVGGGSKGMILYWQLEPKQFPPKDKKTKINIIKKQYDGHSHHCCLRAKDSELVVGGYHQLEVWKLS